MRRRQAAAGLAFVIVTSIVGGCGDAERLVQPTEPTTAPRLPPFSISGRVTDPVYRPLAGAKVVIANGAETGRVEITDEAGWFSVPGPFTDAVTLGASKDGYFPETRQVPPNFFPPGDSAVRETYFQLAPISSRNIAGVYTLTLTADPACTNFPAEARMRTYTLTIVPGGRPGFFEATVSDARFLSISPCPPVRPPATCTYNHVVIRIADDQVALIPLFLEHLGETNYLTFEAWSEGTFGPTGITAALSGGIQYCPSEPTQVDQGVWGCTGSVWCSSQAHGLTLVRR